MAQKKVRDQPTVTRLSWISGGGALTQKRQCTLAGVSRATVYAQRKPVLVIEIDVLLKRLIDEEYTRHPEVDPKSKTNLMPALWMNYARFLRLF